MKQLIATTYERCNETSDPKTDRYIAIRGYVDENGQHMERAICHFHRLDYYTRERIVREYKKS